MSSRLMSAFIFLGLLCVILMVEQFFIGMLQLVFQDSTINFDIFGNVLKFFDVCMDMLFGAMNLLTAALGFFFAVVSFDELLRKYDVFMGAIFKLEDFIIAIVLALVGKKILKKLVDTTSKTSLFTPGDFGGFP